MHNEFVEIKSGNQRLPLFLLATGNGERATENGQRRTDNGEQTTDNGQRTTDNGQRKAEIVKKKK